MYNLGYQIQLFKTHTKTLKIRFLTINQAQFTPKLIPFPQKEQPKIHFLSSKRTKIALKRQGEQKQTYESEISGP